MRSEVRFLRASLRSEFETGDLVALDAAASAVTDWGEVRGFARAHTVTPALAFGLKALGWAGVPDAEAEAIRARREDGVRSALLLTGALVRVVERLEADGVPVLPYKGPTLAIQAFGEVGAREFIDVDLLVPRGAVGRAVSSLGALGYRPMLRVAARDRSAYLRYADELPFAGPDGTKVELQWALAPRYFSIPIDVEDLLSRAGSLRLADMEIPTLEPADLLVVLAVHGGKHLWERLGWVRDLAAVVARVELDWDAALRRAEKARVRRMVLAGLELVRRVAGVWAPAEVQRVVASDADVPSLVSELERRLFRDLEPAHQVPFDALSLRLREHPADRIRHVLRLALTPTLEDRQALVLPRALDLGYLAVRPVRLLAKYGSRGR